MYRRYYIYILTLILVVLISFLSKRVYNDIRHTNYTTNNMIRYQIIPDRWYNAYHYNDYNTWPLEWTNIWSWLQNAWIWSWITPWYHDWFMFSHLEKNIISSYKMNNNITYAMATSSLLRNRWFWWDFLWIEKKIWYLVDLWINGILIHPIWLSLSPMKYDIIDWRHIDPRLTTEFDNRIMTFDTYTKNISDMDRWLTQSDKEFFYLIDEVHDKWLKLVVDMPLLYASVSNYLIKDIALYGKKSFYYWWFDFSDKDHKTDKQSCSLSSFYNPHLYSWTINIYYQWWRGDCTKIYIKRWVWIHDIPDWLYNYYLSVAKRWFWSKIINGKIYDWIDGIRIDAFEEYPPRFLSAFYTDVKRIKPDAIIIGEKWSTDISPIVHFQVDTITFYPIRQRIESFILQKWKWLKEWVLSLTQKIELFYNNNSKISEKLINYTSSHDTDRLLSRFIYTNKDLAIPYFQSSWTDVLRNLGQFAWDSPWISRADHDAHYIHTAPSSWDIKNLYWAIAFQFLMPWSPIVYYGDEVGMYGADDPDNRQPMRRDIKKNFPRHTCERWNDPLEYCLTSNKIEDYEWDKNLIQRYKKLISMKKHSPALQNGTLSMNVCYIRDNYLSCTWRKGNYLLWWFHRKKDSDHIIYLWLLSSFTWNIMLQVNQPNQERKNINNNHTVSSDSKWYLSLNNEDFQYGYMVLENK